MSDPIASHGRGGAGNIGPDGNEYVDGGIVREGEPHGTYVGGRGGGGNVGQGPTGPNDAKDIVPENAQRNAPTGDVHTGRGGAGNTAGEEKKVSLVDKIKGALHK